jgi:hypothetical protein
MPARVDEVAFSATPGDPHRPSRPPAQVGDAVYPIPREPTNHLARSRTLFAIDWDGWSNLAILILMHIGRHSAAASWRPRTRSPPLGGEPTYSTSIGNFSVHTEKSCSLVIALANITSLMSLYIEAHLLRTGNVGISQNGYHRSFSGIHSQRKGIIA